MIKNDKICCSFYCFKSELPAFALVWICVHNDVLLLLKFRNILPYFSILESEKKKRQIRKAKLFLRYMISK